MKNIVLKLLLLLSLSAILFAEDSEDNGVYKYNYFYIGNESFTYKESGHHKGMGADFNSKAKITSPVYATGSLLNFANRFVISMDFISTLSAHDTTENWNFSNGYSQSNTARIGTNSVRFLYHHLLNKHSRVVGGIHYISNSFRRYDYKNAGVIYNNQDIIFPQDKRDASSVIMSEELSNTLMVDIGYWYESKKAGDRGFRYMGNIIYGLPIYQKTTNSTYPTVEFNRKDGYNIDAKIYGGYTIFKGFELGAFISYSYMKREKDRVYLGIDANSDGVEDSILWPDNKSEIYRLGLQAVWNFE